MPIYEYTCPACSHELEVLQNIHDTAPGCPQCGQANMVKKVSAAGFQLKGGGWYATDYKKPAAPSTSETKTDDSKKESTANKPAEKKDTSNG